MNAGGDFLNLRRNVAFAVLAFAINIALVFTGYRIVIAQRGMEAVGLWSTLFAWVSLCRLGDAGMANAVLRFVALCDPATEQARIRRYFTTGLVVHCAVFLLLALVANALLASFVDILAGTDMEDEARLLLPAMVSAFFLMNVAAVFFAGLQGLHLGYAASLITVAGGLLQIAAVFVLVPRFGLCGLALAQAGQHCFSIAASWIILRRTLRSPGAPPAFSCYALREMAGFSLKTQAANTANGLFEPLSKILLSHVAGLHVQGLYELAYKTVSLLRNAAIAGLSASLPAMTRLLSCDVPAARRLYASSVGTVTKVLFFVLACVVVASPVISLLWTGRIEGDYLFFVTVLAAGFLANGWGAAAYNLGLANGRPGGNIAVSLGNLAFLLLAGGLAASVASYHALVLAVGLCLAIGGAWIKRLNERSLAVAISGG
ncbi:MAG: oligosaccharide flippase family protein [Shinella sp.]|nr:oligosaccharide flippase family protein [Shinella sp.]